MSHADMRDMWNHIAHLFEHAYGEHPTPKAIEMYHRAKELAEYHSNLAGDTEASKAIRDLIEEVKGYDNEQR